MDGAYDPSLLVSLLYVIPAMLCWLIIVIFKKRLKKDLEDDGIILSKVEENRAFLILVLVPWVNLCFAASFLINLLVNEVVRSIRLFFPNFFMDKE